MSDDLNERVQIAARLKSLLDVINKSEREHLDIKKEILVEATKLNESMGKVPGASDAINRAWTRASDEMASLASQTKAFQTSFAKLSAETRFKISAAAQGGISGIISRAGSERKLSTLSGHTNVLVEKQEAVSRAEKTKDPLNIAVAKREEASTLKKLMREAVITEDSAAGDKARLDKAVMASSSMAAAKLKEDDTGVMGSIASLSNGFFGLASAQKNTKEGLGQMSFGAQVGSAALDKMMSSFGPLISNMTLASSVVGALGKVIMGAVEGFDFMRKTGGSSMQILEMSTSASFEGIGAGAMYAAARIQEAAGVTDAQAIIMGDAWRKEIVPAAIQGMLAFNIAGRDSESAVYAWTGALAGAAIQGQSIGMSYSKSVELMTKAARAFNGSETQTRNVFSSMIAASKTATMTVDDLNASIGDVMATTARYGAQSSIYRSMGEAFAGSTLDAPTKMALAGGISSMMNDTNRMMAMGTVRHGGSTVEAIREISAASQAGTMPALAKENLKSLLMSKNAAQFGNMSAFEALKSGDTMQQYAAAAFISKQMTGTTDNAFRYMHKDVMDTFGQVVGGQELSEAAAESLKNNFAEEGAQKKGLNAAMTQVQSLELIGNLLKNIGADLAVGIAGFLNTAGMLGHGPSADVRARINQHAAGAASSGPGNLNSMGFDNPPQ